MPNSRLLERIYEVNREILEVNREILLISRNIKEKRDNIFIRFFRKIKRYFIKEDEYKQLY
jgi:hypothetical protein